MERRGRSPTPRDRSRRAASGQSSGKRVAGDSRSDSRSSARRKRSRSRSRTPKVGNKSTNTSKSTTRGSVSAARNEGYENRRRGVRYASQRSNDVSEVLIRKAKNNRRGLPAPAPASAPAPTPAPAPAPAPGGGGDDRANGGGGPSGTGTNSSHRNYPRYDSNRRDIFSASNNSSRTNRTTPVREHRPRDSENKSTKDAKNTGIRADSDALVSSSSSSRRTSPVREHRSRDSEGTSARKSTKTGTHAERDALASSSRSSRRTAPVREHRSRDSEGTPARKSTKTGTHAESDALVSSSRSPRRNSPVREHRSRDSKSNSTRRTSPVREHRSRDSKSRSAKNSTNAGKSTGSDALVSDAALAKWKRPAYSGSSLNNAVLVELRALEQSRQYGDGKHKVLHLQKVADRFDEVAELRERFRPLIVEECVQIVAGELRPLARRHNATTYMLQLLESPPPKSSKAVSVRFKVLTPISTIAHRTMHESTPYLIRAKRANANWLVGMVAKKSHTMSDGILVLDMLLPVELGFDAVLSADTEYEARPGPGLVMFERMYSVKVKKLPFMRKILGMKEPKHVLFSDSDSETNAAADVPKSVNEKTKDATKAVSGAQGNQALVRAFENSPFRASLNVSQKDAITSVLREDHVSSAQKIFMWQGPPGSGKSSTLSRLLGFLCSQFDQSSVAKGTGPTSSAHRIMVCGPSNQSVHVLVDKLRETCSTYGIRCPEIALSAVNDSVPARLQELFVHGVFMEWARRFRKLVGQLSVASAEAELKILLDSIWTRVPHATKAFRVTRDYLGVLTRTYALAVRRQERSAARDKTREEQASDDDTSEVVIVQPLQVKDGGKSTPSQREAPQSPAPKVSPSGDSAAGSTLEKATLGSEKETLTQRWQLVDPEDEETSDYDGVVEIVEERRGRAVSSGPPAKVENKFDSRTLSHLLEENRTMVLQSIFGALRLLVIQPGPLRKFPRAEVVYVRSGFIVNDDGDVVMDRNRSCVGKHGSDFFVSEDEIIQHIPRDAEWIITMRSSLDFLQTCPAVANYLARFTSRSLAALLEELSQADFVPEFSASSQSHPAGGISDAVQQSSTSSSKGAVFVVRDRSSSILSQTSKLSEQIIMDSDDSEDEAETTEAVASNAITSVQQTSGARKAPVAKPQPLSPVMESRVTSKRAQSATSSTSVGEEEKVSSPKSSSDSDSDSDSDSSSSDSSSSDSSDDSSDESDNSAARTKRRKRSGEQGAFLEPIRQSFEAFAAALEELANSRAAEQEFLQTAEVLFCTLAVSGRKSVRAANEAAGLSLLIIDEAAQAVEAETWVALQSVPDRLLLVGDPKQLSATVTSSVAQDLGFGRSLMERLMWGLSLPYHLLKVQYRMHPDISRFPVRFFYNNELEDGANVRGPSPDWFAARGLMDPWYGPYAFLDVPNGREERQGRGSSYYNDAEAEIVARLAQNLVQRGVDVAKELIVITFYSGQVRTIATALSRHHIRNVVVSTVDSFQGSEASVVILSFVRANREGRVGFLSDLRRLNVALTRAKHSLILVGCGGTLSRADDSCMRDLIKDARDRNVYKQLNNAQQPRGIPQVQSRPAHSRSPPPGQPWPQAPPLRADPRFQSWGPHNMLPTPFQPWPQTPSWGVDPRFQAQPLHNRQPAPVPPWSRSSHSRVAPNLQSRSRSRSPLRRDYRGKNAHSDRR